MTDSTATITVATGGDIELVSTRHFAFTRGSVYFKRRMCFSPIR
jgi:hypothetical protein